MMKHILHNILILVMPALCMTSMQSCYNDLGETDTAEVDFIASFPTDTRSFGKAEQINTLVVGIFDDQNTEIERKEFSVSGTSVDVHLTVTKNQTYSFVFWAYDNNQDIYDLDNLMSIKMNPQSHPVTFSQAESADAFFAVEEGVVINGDRIKYVKLLRPLAQINIGTTGAPISALFTAIGAPDTFHPFTNTVSGADDFTYEFIETTTEKFSVENTEYNYLTMGYVFAPITAINIAVELTLTDGSVSKTVEFPQVEIEANSRSNIAGNLTAGSN